MSKGRFITLEGGEGSGKSTALSFIETWLTSHKIDYIATREPGGTELAEEIRALFLQEREEKVHELTELLLVFAARTQHINEKIKPAIEQGVWVLSDRFVDSSYVYQGAARSGDIKKIDILADWVLEGYLPDLTILLDVPVEIGLKRVEQRAKNDRLDRESVRFHETVRNAFLERASQHDHYKIVDASQPILGVNHDIEMCLQYLNNKH
ncbi:dTMP kinase [Marinomonas agarivorans]|nr:dTMP kinase [Marinomonas agarivorans]